MNLKDVLKKIAPALAHLVGGPAAGAVVKEIAGAVLGRDDAKEDEVAAAILAGTGSPDALLKLKELETAHAARLAELGVKYEEIAAGDRANARSREMVMKDHVPAVLAFCVLGVFAAYVAACVFVRQPSSEVTLLVNASTVMVLGYYFGSSAGSAAKDQRNWSVPAK